MKKYGNRNVVAVELLAFIPLLTFLCCVLYTFVLVAIGSLCIVLKGLHHLLM